jgi:hypothetical protein
MRKMRRTPASVSASCVPNDTSFAGRVHIFRIARRSRPTDHRTGGATLIRRRHPSSATVHPGCFTFSHRLVGPPS